MVTVLLAVTEESEVEVTVTVTVPLLPDDMAAFSGNSELPSAGIGNEEMDCPPFRVAVTLALVLVMAAV
jgi:hypothetical protein